MNILQAIGTSLVKLHEKLFLGAKLQIPRPCVRCPPNTLVFSDFLVVDIILINQKKKK